MSKKINWFKYLIVCFGFLPFVALSASSVWQVQKNQSTLYLAGTFHILQPSDYPLPPEFDSAFGDAAVLVFEADVAQLQTPQTQQAMLSGMFNNGTKLQDQLSTETWSRLEEALAKHKIPLAQFNDFKVGMVIMALTLAEFKAMGFTADGVDATFHDKALKKSKSLKFLETVQQQITFLTDMGADNPEQVVRYTLDDLANLPEYAARLKSAWRKGDLKTLEKYGLNDLESQYVQIYQSLIVNRNENWLKQIDGFIKTAETEAIFVGALHLPGKDGLIARLREKGYSVKQL